VIWLIIYNNFCGPNATKGKTKECDSSKILKGSIKKRGTKLHDIEDFDVVPIRSDRLFPNGKGSYWLRSVVLIDYEFNS